MAEKRWQSRLDQNPPERFGVLLIGDGFVDDATVGTITGYEPEDVECAYIPLRCTKCGDLQFAYGSFDIVDAEERQMGADRTCESRHEYDCEKCGNRIEVSVEYQSYPALIQPLQIVDYRGAVYEPISGVGNLMSELRRARGELWNLQELVLDLKEMVAMEDTAKPKDVIDHIRNLLEATSKMVVVLGNYKSLDRLQAVKKVLEGLDYDTILVKELPDPEAKSWAEKSKISMSIARFCVMLDDVAGGQIAEHVYAQHDRIILAHLVPEGAKPTSAMIAEAGREHIKIFPVKDSLEATVRAASVWAEQKYAERKAELEKLRKGGDE